MSTFTELADSELIRLYQQDKNENAMRTLVCRHTDRIYARFAREVRNEADAKDLEQQVWLQVVRNLHSYIDEGKFSHYLARIASNLLMDFWRARGRKSEVFAEQPAHGGNDDDRDSTQRYATAGPQSFTADEEQNSINEEQVDYLIRVLIPNLPVEQRTAWLLRHESEYWETDKRLDWASLAMLNGLTEESAWTTFENARLKLFTAMHQKSSQSALDGVESIVFMMWTQAQRLRKAQAFTWEYFSELLDIPVNTMKTRYRAAQKSLNDGLLERFQD